VAVQLDRVDAALRCGHHAALIPEITRLNVEHPLDERLAE
jgi:hypothetical protein